MRTTSTASMREERRRRSASARPAASKARLVFALLAAVFAIAHAATAGAAVVVTPLAVEGTAAPDGNGAFGSYLQLNEPCINDSNQVAFTARLTGAAGGSSNDEVLIRVAADGTRTVVAREGVSIPGGTGLYGQLNVFPRIYTMNNDGRIAFVAGLTGTPGGTSDNQALFSNAGAGTSIHARRGDPAPGTATTIGSILAPPSINSESPAGIAFRANLGGSSLPGALYIAGGTTLTFIPTLGLAAPDGNGTISSFAGSDPPAIRPNARVCAVWLHLSGTANGFKDDDGIYFAQESGLTKVARGNEAAPGGHRYQEFTEPVCNVFSNAAFLANLYPVPSAGSSVDIAGDGSDDLAAASGRALPDGSHIASVGLPSLSAGNLAAFKADLAGTPGGSTDDSGVYRGDGTILIEVAREGQTVPEGGGEFALFGDRVGINAAAQVLFIATLRNTPGGVNDNRGLYLWDETSGITKLLRTGDLIGGRAVTDFSTLTARDFGGFRCLNDAGVAVARVDTEFFFGSSDGIYSFQRESTTAAPPVRTAGSRATLVAGPNPFGAASLALRFSAPASSPVRITAYDISGRAVRTLLPAPADGDGTLRWDGTDANGRPLPSGVYFVRLETPAEAVVRRVVLAR